MKKGGGGGTSVGSALAAGPAGSGTRVPATVGDATFGASGPPARDSASETCKAMRPSAWPRFSSVTGAACGNNATPGAKST
eukprot:628734-Alexandrium_andersonii.AAC.1